MSLGRADVNATLRVFMFPFAGGGPTALRAYGSAWPAGVAVYAAQMPGRERRIAEPPLRRASEAAGALAQALEEADDRPFVLCGHSLGAALAHATARSLQSNGGPQPLRLMVSGFALGAPPRADPYHRLPDPEFIGALHALGGTPPEVLQNRTLMAMLLPTLRADFEMAETYVPEPGPSLRCPITVLAGLRDPEAPPAAMAGWTHATEASCTTHALDGGHFFFTERVDEVVRVAWATLNNAHVALSETDGSTAPLRLA
jgi:medium-chain acyl-[acyl-carrier-protein] hydrolase